MNVFWCAGFATFCLEQACGWLGVKMPIGHTLLCDDMANAPGFVKGTTPGAADRLRPGSFFLELDKPGSSPKYKHCGVILGVRSDGKLDTIEGNSNTRRLEQRHRDVPERAQRRESRLRHPLRRIPLFLAVVAIAAGCGSGPADRVVGISATGAGARLQELEEREAPRGATPQAATPRNRASRRDFSAGCRRGAAGPAKRCPGCAARLGRRDDGRGRLGTERGRGLPLSSKRDREIRLRLRATRR